MPKQAQVSETTKSVFGISLLLLLWVELCHMLERWACLGKAAQASGCKPAFTARGSSHTPLLALASRPQPAQGGLGTRARDALLHPAPSVMGFCGFKERGGCRVSQHCFLPEIQEAGFSYGGVHMLLLRPTSGAPRLQRQTGSTFVFSGRGGGGGERPTVTPFASPCLQQDRVVTGASCGGSCRQL